MTELLRVVPGAVGGGSDAGYRRLAIAMLTRALHDAGIYTVSRKVPHVREYVDVFDPLVSRRKLYKRLAKHRKRGDLFDPITLCLEARQWLLSEDVRPWCAWLGIGSQAFRQHAQNLLSQVPL